DNIAGNIASDIAGNIASDIAGDVSNQCAGKGIGHYCIKISGSHDWPPLSGVALGDSPPLSVSNGVPCHPLEVAHTIALCVVVPCDEPRPFADLQDNRLGNHI